MTYFRDFPGGRMAKTLCSQCRGPEFDPDQGIRSHVLQLRAHSHNEDQISHVL